jgi:hypothetical protein
MSVSQLLWLEATGIGQATLLGNCDSEANKEGAMLNSKRFFQKVAIGVALAACVFVAHANVPRSWFIAGSKPQEFEAGVDAAHTYQGQASAFLKSKPSNVDGFGTLMQSIQAEQYKGKRVRLSGFVNSQEVVGWAGLWMRVDQGKDAVAFDNMEDRPIKGTTSWQRYDVVLDVPQDATGISFGILLDGMGEVWLSSTKFDVVGADVLVTGRGERKIPDKPVNLEFTE